MTASVNPICLAHTLTKWIHAANFYVIWILETTPKGKCASSEIHVMTRFPSEAPSHTKTCTPNYAMERRASTKSIQNQAASCRQRSRQLLAGDRGLDQGHSLGPIPVHCPVQKQGQGEPRRSRVLIAAAAAAATESEGEEASLRLRQTKKRRTVWKLKHSFLRHQQKLSIGRFCRITEHKVTKRQAEAAATVAEAAISTAPTTQQMPRFRMM